MSDIRYQWKPFSPTTRSFLQFTIPLCLLASLKSVFEENTYDFFQGIGMAWFFFWMSLRPLRKIAVSEKVYQKARRFHVFSLAMAGLVLFVILFAGLVLALEE